MDRNRNRTRGDRQNRQEPTGLNKREWEILKNSESEQPKWVSLFFVIVWMILVFLVREVSDPYVRTLVPLAFTVIAISVGICRNWDLGGLGDKVRQLEGMEIIAFQVNYYRDIVFNLILTLAPCGFLCMIGKNHLAAYYKEGSFGYVEREKETFSSFINFHSVVPVLRTVHNVNNPHFIMRDGKSDLEREHPERAEALYSVVAHLFGFCMTLIVIGRTVLNVGHLCWVSRANHFLTVVTHDMRSILLMMFQLLFGIVVFNWAADVSQDKPPKALFMIVLLTVWTILCGYDCSRRNKHLRVSFVRTNDADDFVKIYVLISAFLQLVLVAIIMIRVFVVDSFIDLSSERLGGSTVFMELYDYFKQCKATHTHSTDWTSYIHALYDSFMKTPKTNPVVNIFSVDLMCVLVAIGIIARLIQHYFLLRLPMPNR